MCDCLTWHHPLWAVVGRRAGVKPGVVWSIFSALRAGDPVLDRLSPRDKVRTLAVGLGWKPAEVVLVLASLQHSGVVDDDLRLAQVWRDVPATSQRLGDASRRLGDDRRDGEGVSRDAAEVSRRRALRAARNRRYRDKPKASGYSARNNTKGFPQGYPPSHPAAEQEEDRDNRFFSPQEDAGEHSSGRHPTIIKREALAVRVLARAQRSMRPADYGRFLDEINEGDRYERFLQRGSTALPPRLRETFERLVTESRPRDGPASPPPNGQRSLLLPIDGRQQGVTEEERLRRYRERVRSA